jgi:hypothetical protein
MTEKTQKTEKERQFEKNCERYRAMMKSIKNEPYSVQRDRINSFRAGIM